MRYRSNEEIYRNEINTSDDYRITITEFKTWLLDNDMTETFFRSLHNEDDYDVAVDYSLPISLVKYFRKLA